MLNVVTAERQAIGMDLKNLSRTALHCLEEARPSVQIIFFLRFLSALTLASGNVGVWPDGLTEGGISWILGTLFVYIINGASDVVEDQLNGSGRPIGRGALSPRAARRAAWLCAGAALLISPDLPMAALLLAYLGTGYAYSAPSIALKRRSYGTVLVVLLLGGLTYAAGWFASGGDQEAVPVLVFGGALTLWMCLVGALVKDLSDVRGDTAAGRRTAVVAWGERRARVVCAVNPVLVGGGFLFAARLFAPMLTAPAALVLAGGLVVAALTMVTKSDEHRRRSRLPYRAFMVTQYLAHIALLAILLG